MFSSRELSLRGVRTMLGAVFVLALVFSIVACLPAFHLLHGVSGSDAFDQGVSAPMTAKSLMTGLLVVLVLAWRHASDREMGYLRRSDQTISSLWSVLDGAREALAARFHRLLVSHGVDIGAGPARGESIASWTHQLATLRTRTRVRPVGGFFLVFMSTRARI